MKSSSVADAHEVFRIVSEACDLWDAAEWFEREGNRGVYFSSLVDSLGWSWQRVKEAVDALVAIGTCATSDTFYTRVFTRQPPQDRTLTDHVMSTIRRKERNVEAYESGDGL